MKTAVGYTGGRDDVKNPSYQDVCSGETGHAEAVQIEFDPQIVKYEELVGKYIDLYGVFWLILIICSAIQEFFYRTHDPTTKDRQGNDVGTNYRSAIFTHSDEQAQIAKAVTSDIQAKHFDTKGLKIVTTIEPFKEWFPAEDYHQEYLLKNPSGYHCATHILHW